jgi:hypothetical protein
MTSETMKSRTSSVELDLGDGARAYDRASILPRRVLMAFAFCLGAAMIAAGILVRFPPTTADQSRLLIIGGGLAIAVATIWGITLLPKSATWVSVDNERLELRVLGGGAIKVGWSNMDARIQINDWTSIPPEGRSRGLRGIQYVLAVGHAAEAPVGKEIVNSVVHQARDHGLTVIGDIDAKPPSGRARVIQVSRRK